MGNDEEDHEKGENKEAKRVLRAGDRMEELLMGAIEKFNMKAEADEKLRGELEGVHRKVLIQIEDERDYHFVLDNVKIADFGVGNIETPDITISSDTETIVGLFKREIGPMKALATKKLRLKGSLQDMLRIRKLF
jgi:putative sterol carrier protein